MKKTWEMICGEKGKYLNRYVVEIAKMILALPKSIYTIINPCNAIRTEYILLDLCLAQSFFVSNTHARWLINSDPFSRPPCFQNGFHRVVDLLFNRYNKIKQT